MRRNFVYILAIALLILCAASLFIFSRSGSEANFGRPEARAENKSIAASKIDSEKSLGQNSGVASKPTKVGGKSKAYVLGEQTKSPPGNAIEAIERLKPLAESGDVTAAYAIHLKLRECRNAFSSPPDDELLNVYQKAGIPKERILADYEKTFKDCESARDLLGEEGKWLEQAADNGSLEAQLLYATDPQPFVGNASEMLRNPDKVKTYKVKAMDYLNRAADAGNVDAMLGLASAYEGGNRKK